ncbi:hypothetical protein [Neorhizobium sp. NCHU2750]|uniref:hypothetical protein n=1 Tax=Neorhizobium sp. NCHU2750 TaxID=1825976 RepID=UPI000E773197|nr:hypothetical protein NCHU2750_15420 [Neorhizobium sp. NCHU2750]
MQNQSITIPHAKPTFYFADAHAGSGKTYSAHQFIAGQNDFFTIATQTNELSDQQAKDLAEIGISATVIQQKKSSDNCTKKYKNHCSDKRTSVALINQGVAFQNIKEAAHQNLIVDEFPSPVTKVTLTEDISATREFISKLIKAKPCEYEGWLEVIDTEDTTEIAEFGKKRESSVPSHVIELCKRVHSPHHRSFVAAKNYVGFISGLEDDEGISSDSDDSKKKMVIYSFVQPSILSHYKSVTFMGANFAYSKLYRYWADKVDWVVHPSIEGVRYEDFSHKAPLIDLYHLSEEMLSWTHLSKRIGYDNFVLSVADVIEQQFPKQPHIVTMSAKGEGSWRLKTGEAISPNPVGLNAYQDRYLAVHLAPLLQSNMDSAIWLAVAGMTASELFVSQAIELLYQFLTRTAVRDGKKYSEDHPEDQTRLSFVGLDRGQMEYVGSIFGVSKPSVLLEVPALTEYTRAPRKQRSDKKSDDEKRASKSERQKQRRAEKKAQASL